MKPHVERLQAEVFDLNDKMQKLENFLLTESVEMATMSNAEAALLHRQYEAMQEYFEIASTRFVIELHKENRK